MKWHSGVNSFFVAGAYILFVWVFVCVFNAWEVFGEDVHTRQIILGAAISAAILGLLIVGIVTQFTARRRRLRKHVAIGFLLASMIIMILLVLWMPFNGYDWDTVLIITAILFVIAVIIAAAHTSIKSSFYYIFMSPKKRQKYVKGTRVTHTELTKKKKREETVSLF